MIVLLSPEQRVPEEPEIVGKLLESGLSLFHIRKYAFSDADMLGYVQAIADEHRRQLVLHSHFHLADQLGIGRLHIREEARLQDRHQDLATTYTLSTSVHSITAFNALEAYWDYAFLSPVFPSISKPGYGCDRTVLACLSERRNPNLQLIGLGGVYQGNYRAVLDAGADGIALLGAVWNSDDPIGGFRSIDRHYLSNNR